MHNEITQFSNANILLYRGGEINILALKRVYTLLHAYTRVDTDTHHNRSQHWRRTPSFSAPPSSCTCTTLDRIDHGRQVRVFYMFALCYGITFSMSAL